MSHRFGALPTIERRFPLLATLMDAYFHQDFDLAGETVAEIVGEWRASASAADIERLRTEVQHYRALVGSEIETAFERDFKPQIIPAAFSGSTAQFLQEIVAAL